MASLSLPNIEELVKEKVEEGIKDITVDVKGRETREASKLTKEITEKLVPELAKIIAVSVSLAMTTAFKEVASELAKMFDTSQKQALLNRYETDKLEQYQRKDNLCIYGLEEENEETEDVVEAKVIELAADMGVTLVSDNISVAHRLGKPQASNRSRPVIVRFCHRKKRNEMLKKRAELKKKQRKVFVNEDLTPMRVAMFKIVKEQPNVKSVTTRDGKILVWLTDKNRPVEIHTPDDLFKTGILQPDWKRLKLDNMINKTLSNNA